MVVFEVGGTLDLQRQNLRITQPFITIAGQTAPAPGITIIQGGIAVNADDVIIQHLRVRPGQAGQDLRSGWAPDAISVSRAANVIVDHCSLTWGVDENLSASGSRFGGNSPDQWPQHTARNVTFSHNLIAEGLAYSSHPKGEHSKGLLVHDNASNIVLYGNLFAHNYERSPLLKGGSKTLMVNNLIYNPGSRAIHYNLIAWEWTGQPLVTGQLSAVGNVMRAGPSTRSPIALLMIGGDGDLEFFGRDNLAVDQVGEPLAMLGRYTTGTAQVINTPKPLLWFEGLNALPAAEVERWVMTNVGARPFDRDSHDIRILSDVAEGRGEIIDHQDQVGGYPEFEPTKRAFNPDLWNLEDMSPK